MQTNIFVQLAVSLLLGLLVGLQRERTEPSIAGIRTFSLISIFGTICGAIAIHLGGWIIAAGLIAIAALFIIGNFARIKSGDHDPGLTTEMAALVMFGVGAYLAIGSMGAAVVIGGAVAILLQAKKPMHTFVAKMGDQDIKAIMQFVLITLVILPVLPNHTFGPYSVLNPFKVWLFVVLIVAISLCGYVAYKWLGARTGTILGGIIGGLISSTATTLSYARRATTATSGANLAALVIMLASTTLYVRVLVLIAAVAGNDFLKLFAPLATMLAICILICLVLYRLADTQHAEMPVHGNPAELKYALLFGAIYAIVIVAAAAAKAHFGSRGLYSVAVLSGLTDVDAITLSSAQFVASGSLASDTGWRSILVASMANLVFKAGIASVLGGPALLKRVGIAFGAAFVAGVLILWFWPT